MTGLDTGEDIQDEPVVIPQQNEGAREGNIVTGPRVLAHTNLAKTGGK
jgi:hypothetical protein